MEITPAMRSFILHWGEMGTRWGTNRSVAQIHALLHIAPRPLPADEIAETLAIARSNVSTGIRDLQGWGLVRLHRELGDRRDHFLGLEDMVDVARTIVEVRREREIRPTIATLEETVAAAATDGTPPDVLARMRETLEMLALLDGWYREMARLPRSTQMTLLRLGARIARFLPKAEE